MSRFASFREQVRARGRARGRVTVSGRRQESVNNTTGCAALGGGGGVTMFDVE